MKEVYCFQEVSTDIAQGEKVSFPFHPVIYVTLVRKSRESQEITATIELCLYTSDDCIAIVEQTFETIQAVLNAFDLPDHVELFEMVEE